MGAGSACSPSYTQCTRECLRLVADRGLNGQKVAAALEPIVQHRGAPQAITVDNGSEFASRALDVWAYKHGIHLDFIRPRKPVEKKTGAPVAALGKPQGAG